MSTRARAPISRATRRELEVERRLQALERRPAQTAGGAGGTSWGSITGTLSAQSDLSSALAAKANTSALGTAAATSASDYATAAHGHGNATTSAAGFMSATDKAKLDGIAAGAVADAWAWLKLANASVVSTTTFANVSGMSFTAAANTTYLVDVIGAYQTAATTTGIALTLDFPSGTIIGMNVVSTSATALGGTEVIADAASTGATTGVRAANTNTPITARFVVAVGATGGTVQLMQRSEVAASNTTLQAGLTIMGFRAV